MHPIQYHAFLLTHHNVLFKSVLAFLLILLPFFFIEKKNQKNYKFITLSKRFQAFALVDQRYFSIDFAIFLKFRFFILKTNEKFSIENQLICHLKNMHMHEDSFLIRILISISDIVKM